MTDLDTIRRNVSIADADMRATMDEITDARRRAIVGRIRWIARHARALAMGASAAK